MKITLSTLILFCYAVISFSQTIGTTEAIEYDPSGNRWFITNSNSILVQPSGTDELEFFGETGAGFGMEVIGNTLFSISGGTNQTVNFHDLSTEEEINEITIPGDDFLNGMASDPAGNRIWITDFGTAAIYEIDVADLANPVVTTVVANAGCTPNGITYDEANNRLVHTCWTGGNIKAIDLTDYSSSNLINIGLGGIDGIDHDENGNFYISSWQPTRITRLSDEFSTEETISAPGISNPADISYAVEIDSLGIANSNIGTVSYVYFGSTDNVFELNFNESFEVYPNPVTDESYFTFNLDQRAECELTVYDLQGKKIITLVEDALPAGNHKVLFSGIELEKGTYVCELTAGKNKASIQIIR